MDSASSDPNGGMITFSWRFLSAPLNSNLTDADIVNPTTPAPSFTPDVDGAYELELTVTDPGALSDTDTVIITGTSANAAPNADAGPDQTAEVNQVVNLDGGNSTDPDNGPNPLTFQWVFATVAPGSALTNADITNPTSPQASFTPDVTGVYTLTLTVSDGDLTDSDDVAINVTPVNVPPNADAGADVLVKLGEVATLNGAASSDPDNFPNPLTFQWSFISVAAGSALTDANITNATTPTPSFTPDQPGMYTLQLVVSDGSASDSDEVMVKANAAPVALDDAFDVDEDTPLTVAAPGVLANDTDANNDALTAVLDTGPTNAQSFTLNPDGSFDYTPTPDFSGEDSFTYHANDDGANGGNGASNTVIEDFNGTNGGGFRILNNSVNLGSLIITGSTFRNSAAGNAFQMETGGTSNATVSVEGGSLFTNNFGDGVQAVTTTGSTGTVSVTVKNSTFSSALAGTGNGGIFFAPFGGPVTFNFDIDTNSFSDIMRPLTNLGAINITDGDLDGGGPTVTGTIRNNTLNNIVGSRGIAVIADTFAGPLDLTINNNNVDRLGSTTKHAIFTDVRNSVTNADARVTNNDIGQSPSPSPAGTLWTAGNGTAEAVLVQCQNSASVNALVTGNVIDANATLEVMRVRAINSCTNNATVTGNDLNDTSAAHIEFAAATGTGAAVGGGICLNISGNIFPAPGVIQISQNAAPGVINVVQASAAAVSTANSNANVQVTGTPTFNQPACTLPSP